MTQVDRRTRSGLGRGLGALIPQRAPESRGLEIPLARISRNPYQPRHEMERTELERLAESIREHGVLQPVVVTETLDGYELVAGERRVRAAEIAGLGRIPAVVRQAAPREQLELALVENVQRADLNAIEEAKAYRQLVDEFGMSQDEVALRVGRSRSTVANTLRLLDFSPRVQQAVADSSITEGHARAIGSLERAELQDEVLSTVLARRLSVRETEELSRRLRARPASSAPASTHAPRREPELDHIEQELRTALGTKVTVTQSRRGGRIVIEYYAADELERLYDRLVGARQ